MFHERQGTFNRNKLSGSFTKSHIYSRREIKQIWDSVYSSKEKQTRSAQNNEITEKHLMYHRAFSNLGFFDFAADNNSPVVLQAGVGHGKTLQTMASKYEGLKPIGLDISFLSLNDTKNRNLGDLVQGDILDLPFRDESIDRVFEVGVAEHLYSSDPFIGQIVDREGIVKSFHQLYRVIKPGGKVGFIQPSKHSALPLSKKLDVIMGRWDMGFQEDFGLNDFCQLVSLGGFGDIRFVVMQAPDDFPARIRLGDAVLKSYANITGQYNKSEMTGALFAVVGTKV